MQYVYIWLKIFSSNYKKCYQHERAAFALGVDFIFVHAYAAWVRYTNENMNGLIRQFFCQGSALRFVCLMNDDIALAMHRRNLRFKKMFGRLNAT